MPINPNHIVDRWEKMKNKGMSRAKFIYHYNKNYNKRITSDTLTSAIAAVKDKAKRQRDFAKARSSRKGSGPLGVSRSKKTYSGPYKGDAHGNASSKGRSRGDVST